MPISPRRESQSDLLLRLQRAIDSRLHACSALFKNVVDYINPNYLRSNCYLSDQERTGRNKGRNFGQHGLRLEG